MSQSYPTASPTPVPGPSEIERTPAEQGRRGLLWVSKGVTFVVYVYVMAIEIILTLGFVLLLLGANPSSSFVEWIYRSLDRVMRPFRGIFEPVELGTGGNDVPSVFEPSVLFAMIVYAIVALVVHAALTWLSSRLARLDREEEMRRRELLIQQSMAASAAPTWPVDAAQGAARPAAADTTPPGSVPPPPPPDPAPPS